MEQIRMKRLLAVAVILSAASFGLAQAKSTAPVARDIHSGVLYSPLSPARWRVGFNGAGAFDQEKVEQTVLRAAAKLTLSQGFDWFQPIGERPEPVETATAIDMKRPDSEAPSQDLYLKWGELCAADWVFGPNPDKLCGDVAAADRPFQTSTQIIMGHGPAPANGIALDARAAERQTRGLEPQLTRARGPWLPKLSMPHIWPF